MMRQSEIDFGQTTTPPTDNGVVQMVQVQSNTLQVADDVPVIQHFGFASALPVGTLVVRLLPLESPDRAVIIASSNQKLRPVQLHPGQSVQHDAYGSTILLSNDASARISAKGTTHVNSAVQRTTGSIVNDTGVTCTFTTIDGKVISVVNGQIVHVAADPTIPTNPSIIRNLIIELQNVDVCAEIQQRIQDAINMITDQSDDINDKLKVLGPLLKLLTNPGAVLTEIVEWIKNFIDYYLTNQFKPYFTLVAQLQQVAQDLIELQQAAQEAISKATHCQLTLPSANVDIPDNIIPPFSPSQVS